MKRAGFFIRAAASLLDGVFAGIPAILLCSLVGPNLLKKGMRMEEARVVITFVFFGLTFPYVFTEVLFARSPGKKLLRLTITNTDGSPADRWTLLLRWLTKFSPWLLNLFALALMRPSLLSVLASLLQLVIVLGCLAVLGEGKRSFHDRWSRTAVYREPPVQAVQRGFDVIAPAHAESSAGV